MEDGAKKPIKIFGNDRLSDRVATFQKKAEEHKHKQKSNPFSGQWDGGLDHPVWDKSDPRYGRPVEGSKTERRGIQAGNLISGEVRQLCDMIYQYGHPLPDGRTIIAFGELFEMYTRISNKVVGILMRARKHGLVNFEGEMLFQRRDDHVIITLIKTIEELHELYGDKGPIPERQRKVDDDDDEDDDSYFMDYSSRKTPSYGLAGRKVGTLLDRQQRMEKEAEDDGTDVAFLDVTSFKTPL